MFHQNTHSNLAKRRFSFTRFKSGFLIANLASNYPKASFIDIGSGFEILATKKDTIDWHQEHKCKKEDNYTLYEHQINYFKELLPEDF